MSNSRPVGHIWSTRSFYLAHKIMCLVVLKLISIFSVYLLGKVQRSNPVQGEEFTILLS